MQESQSEIDAIEALRIKLEEAFSQWATECAKNIIQNRSASPRTDAFGNEYYPSDDPYIVEAIYRWREISREYVTKGFNKLLHRIQTSQLSSDHARARAADLAWEAIDTVYGWQSGREKPDKFIEWFRHAEAIDDLTKKPPDIDLPLLYPGCKGTNRPTAVQLNCDFRRMFESHLTALRLEVQLDDCALEWHEPKMELSHKPSSNLMAKSPWYFDEDLTLRNSKTAQPLRRDFVEKIKQELGRHRPDLPRLSSDFVELAAKNPNCIAFDIYRRATQDRRIRLDKCVKRGAYEELAYELAAAATGLSPSALKKAWCKKKGRKKEHAHGG
jgi:hypothetical protein